MNEYEKAKEYYNKAVEINKKIGIQKRLLKDYENLSFFYESRGNYKKAINYIEKIIEIDRNMNLDRIYSDQARLKKLQKEANQN